MNVRTAHTRFFVLLLLILAMTVAGRGAAPAAATPAAAAHVTAAHVTATPAVSGPAVTLGSAGWKVLTSATATQGGAQISTPGFATASWLPVAADDGGGPGTEIEALLQNGKCPNVFYSNNMKTCFGSMTKVGAETVAQFKDPWWYRTDFNASLQSGQYASLIVNGIVGQADVWVNGHEVATQSTVQGAYTRYTFDVTGILTSGANSLALEVYPNDPSKMLTLDDVDWNQIPPDNNTGIQFPVQLQVANALSIANTHVVESNNAALTSSALTVKGSVTNHSSSAQTGTVSATVTAPGGSGAAPITVQQSVTVPANSTQTVTFAPSGFPGLTISQPKVWWPYQMGAQPLYTLTSSVTQGSTVSNSTSGTFGIRSTSSAIIGKSTLAPDGARQFSVNGVPFVVRGGGFAEDLFLHYDAADIAKQVAILKNLGVNMLRLEGHFMPDDFYQQMDAAGIMIYSGYQCCDAWEGTISGQTLTVATNSALTVAQNEVDHPSVVAFSWSDNAPAAADESATLAQFKAADFNVPVVSSAEENPGPTLGASGQKEGPYDYVPPNYWYDNTHGDSGDSQTNAGGSWGLDTEESAGDTIPTQDSMNRFLSPADQNALWQSPGANQYHANYETGTGDYKFGTVTLFDKALSARYGAPTSLNNYVEEAQVQNYENTRAQFEAFMAHSTSTPTPSTGTIYWQLNKGWPTVLWDLYNEDGDQAGSFYGAKKANEPLHALYTQDNGTVALDNIGSTTQSGVSVEAKVYSLAGAVLDDQTVSGISLTGQQVRTSVITPKVPTGSTAQTYFVELTVRQGSTVVDRNVYWQSTQKDAVNWSSTIDHPAAVLTTYANLQGLNSLAASTIKATAVSQAQAGPNGADTVTHVTLTNTSTTPTVGFFLRTDVRRGTASGAEASGDNQLPSALWSDNDITLWPGESQTVSVSYKSADLAGATPVISVSGWNAAKQDVAAPIGGGGGDTQAPSAPANLRTTSVASGSVALAWDASTDNVGVTGYDVYRDGSLLSTVTGTTATDATVAASTSYSYTVKAHDAAGNASAASTALSVTTPAAGGGGDTQPPTVPANLRTTSVASGSVALAWDASTDNVGVTGYDVYRDGSLLSTVTGTTATDSTVAPSTSYLYSVRAHDAAGNASASGTALSVTTPAAPGGNKSYEAEAATLAGGTTITNCSHCSGGKKLSYLGNGGTATFTGISEPATGSYTLTIYFMSVGQARSATVTVNGTPQTVNFPETPDYNTVVTKTVTVQRNAGSGNTITFSNPSAGAPNLDRIVV
ncbi:glycosyl hydrolase 2 galactose-binding domain-containing protein [Streptacidiphilus sp. PAMC 29251]